MLKAVQKFVTGLVRIMGGTLPWPPVASQMRMQCKPAAYIIMEMSLHYNLQSITLYNIFKIQESTALLNVVLLGAIIEAI